MILNVNTQLKSQLSNILPLILKNTPNKHSDKQQKILIHSKSLGNYVVNLLKTKQKEPVVQKL